MKELENYVEQVNKEKQRKILPENIKLGVEIFDVLGTLQEGVDTSSATASAENILSPKTAYVKGEKVTGTMPNNGTLAFTPSETEQTIPEGYTSGGTIAGDVNLTPENIKKSVQIFNVEGTYEGLDTSDGTATAMDILTNRVAYVNGNRIVGELSSFYEKPMMNPTEVTTKYLYQKNQIKAKIYPDKEFALSTGGYIVAYVPHADIANAISLTSDQIVQGNTVLDVEGTAELGTDTTDATASSSDLSEGKTAYVNGEKVTGTIRTKVSGNEVGYKQTQIVRGTETVAGYPDPIPFLKFKKTMSSDILYRAGSIITIYGYLDDVADFIELTPEKIVKGNTILNVEGSFEGLDTSDATATAADLVSGVTAYVGNEKIEGEFTLTDEKETPMEPVTIGEEFAVMPDENTQTLSLYNKTPIRCGYEAESWVGTGVPYMDVAMAIGLVPEVILEGNTILGIEGEVPAVTSDDGYISTDNSGIIVNYSLIQQGWVPTTMNGVSSLVMYFVVNEMSQVKICFAISSDETIMYSGSYTGVLHLYDETGMDLMTYSVILTVPEANSSREMQYIEIVGMDPSQVSLVKSYLIEFDVKEG